MRIPALLVPLFLGAAVAASCAQGNVFDGLGGGDVGAGGDPTTTGTESGGQGGGTSTEATSSTSSTSSNGSTSSTSSTSSTGSASTTSSTSSTSTTSSTSSTSSTSTTSSTSSTSTSSTSSSGSVCLILPGNCTTAECLVECLTCSKVGICVGNACTCI